jgi:rod shape-determining protein MreC
LSFVPTSADIRVGDLLVTSGLAHRFPAGYPVGEVTSVEVDPGEPFARIIVTPSARVGRAREVLLVWPGQQLTESTQISVVESGVEE